MSGARVGPRKHPAGLRRPAPLAGLLLALLLGAAPAAAGITVAVHPPTQNVAPGAEFELTLQVTQSGSSFNGFDAIVGYTPSALTLLPLSPLSQQEGSLMTGACPNRFHRFREGVDRDTITDVLLCSGVSLTGPGQIYRLRFRASATTQTTTVNVIGAGFYDAGIAVTPVSSSNATVVIGTEVGVAPGPQGPGAVRLRASPNPSRSPTRLEVETAAAGFQELGICDLLGREVCRLESGWFDAGRRTVAWDGRDDAGVAQAPGVYFARLRTSAGMLRTAIVRLR